MKKPPKGAFAEFIRGLPMDMPRSEVMARAKKAGLKFHKTTVDSTRMRMRRALQEERLPAPTPPALEAAWAHESATEPTAVPVTSAAFVRSLPSDMSTAEVIAKGAEAGLTVSVASVHNARSVLRRKGVLADKGSPPRSPAREFVRSLPLDLPGSEVIARAAAAGFTITRAAVHTVRYDMRHRNKEGLRAPPGAARSAARVSRAPSKREPVGDPSREAKRQQFKALILELGMDDAESIWEDFASIRNGIRR